MYQPAWWLRNGHIQSIYPSVFRRVSDHFFKPERIDTPDGDFLDLDWSQNDNKRLVILTHGLEGHSRRPYVLGMAKAAIQKNWDVLAWNFRSCSGEPNRMLKSYHSGATNDLSSVIEYARSNHPYQEIALIGFSIGGNKTLVHLGRNKSSLPKEIMSAVTFSVPCDLSSCSQHLAKTRNTLYMKNFLNSFKQKLTQKKDIYPNDIDLKNFKHVKNFYDYDSEYTAPLNGFRSAEEYWAYSSSNQFVEDIDRPTLIVNAQDDPFLTPSCFPHEQANKNKYVTLETPKYGGHVGFMQFNQDNTYWSEQRAIQFIDAASKLS